MNRDIKFRVWDKIRKEFTEDGRYKNEFVGIALGFYSDVCISKDDLVIQQYTELKDKNGTEIYEGDILHFYENNEIDNFITNKYIICKYTLDNAWFSFVENINDVYDGYYWMEIDNKCEVVGNIFQNPELL